MASINRRLPCDGEGNCMVCGIKPSAEETLNCSTCATPWHVDCLADLPETLAATATWDCPDCADPSPDLVGASASASAAGTGVGDGNLIAAIKAIEADSTLSEQEKAQKRQELMSGGNSANLVDESEEDPKGDNDILSILGENIKCAVCMQLPHRPVTTPCGHNFCLKCIERWVNQGKKTCVKCRKTIPARMRSQPRINSSVVCAIRMARMPTARREGAPRVIHFVKEEELPDKAFTTDRAKRKGLANAKSGRIFVTIPNDHFGPILAENDPVKKTGVLVGDTWSDRMACRQWGAHFPHVAGIAGQAKFGAQSVVLAGGYEHDEDHGEWFLYTGSGGFDLSGNKRTCKIQIADQEFTSYNEALRLSCIKGYPIRVVRSHKDARFNYAPESGVRYDGIYRIEKCWIRFTEKGFRLCRYLFTRCDNSPAPWTGDGCGDRPRQLPGVPELDDAVDVTERKDSPHWDFDESDGCWKWKKPPPMSRDYKKGRGKGRKGMKKGSKKSSKEKVLKGSMKYSEEKILKEFSCLLCTRVMTLPITTPCAHNFCKPCLDAAFAGQAFMKERNKGGRQLRTRKNVMKCPACPTDISEFLQHGEVNRDLMGAIEALKHKLQDLNKDASTSGTKTSEVQEAKAVCAAAPKRKRGPVSRRGRKPNAKAVQEASDVSNKEAGVQPSNGEDTAASKKRGAGTSGVQRRGKSRRTNKSEPPSPSIQ